MLSPNDPSGSDRYDLVQICILYRRTARVTDLWCCILYVSDYSGIYTLSYTLDADWAIDLS